MIDHCCNIHEQTVNQMKGKKNKCDILSNSWCAPYLNNRTKERIHRPQVNGILQANSHQVMSGPIQKVEEEIVSADHNIQMRNYL
jgi:hypothetical protein